MQPEPVAETYWKGGYLLYRWLGPRPTTEIKLYPSPQPIRELTDDEIGHIDESLDDALVCPSCGSKNRVAAEGEYMCCDCNKYYDWASPIDFARAILAAARRKE